MPTAPMKSPGAYNQGSGLGTWSLKLEEQPWMLLLEGESVWRHTTSVGMMVMC